MPEQSAWSIDIKIKTVSLIIISSIFFVVLLWQGIFPGLFKAIDYKYTDILFKIRYHIKGKENISPYLVNVVLDDSSINQLNLTRWDRSVHGRVIKLLTDAGAQGIACDIMFIDPTTTENDQVLIEALKNSEKVYMPVITVADEFSVLKIFPAKETNIEPALWQPRILREGIPAFSSSFYTSFDSIQKQAYGTGHINYFPDTDGMIRTFPLLIKLKDGYIPSLSFSMVCDYLKVDPGNIEISFGHRILLKDAVIGEDITKDIEIPIDEEGRIRINFAGPWENSFHQFPVVELLKAENNRAHFSQLSTIMNKSLVVFSDVSFQNQDYGAAVFDSVYPLCGIHLNVANMILTENFLSAISLPEMILITLFFIIGIYIFATRLKPFIFAIANLLLLVCFVLYTFCIFFFFNKVGFFALPVTAFFLSFIFLNIYKIFMAEKKKTLYKAGLEASQIITEQLKELDNYKTRFIQNITHEFRTPLTLINGPVDLMLERVNTLATGDLKKNLRLIKNNSGKILNLINQLLDLAKLEAGEMKLCFYNVHISEWLSSFVDNFKDYCNRKKIQLCFIDKTSGLTTGIDKEKMEKVISNLLSNAVKFTPPEGRITVELFIAPEKTFSGQKKSFSIRIKDTGRGIPEKDKARIFERFFQVESDGSYLNQGTGIGLALVKEFVQLHEGVIELTSNPGKGSEFIITLPFRENCKDAGSADLPENQTVNAFLPREGGTFDSGVSFKTRNEPVELQKKTVLIVDDDYGIRQFVMEILKEQYRCCEAEDGEAALKVIRKTIPHLVLTDLMMPGMNGPELIKKLKRDRTLAMIPVIMMTVKNSQDAEALEPEGEPDEYLSKPFAPSELLKRIQSVLKVNFINRHYIQKRVVTPHAQASSSGKYPAVPILIVDDEPAILENYRELLNDKGINNLVLFNDSRKVMPFLKKEKVSLIITDLSMPYLSGKELLIQVKEVFPGTAVIIVSGISTVKNAVESVRLGAYDYMVKPIEINKLTAAIEHCLEMAGLEQEVGKLSNSLKQNHLEFPEAFNEIITGNRRMFSLFKYMEALSDSQKPVLVSGESGSGKELFARAIHKLSRGKGKFIAVNIAGLDDTVFSDTLFGHKKGAFTGADTDRKGLIEEAEGGTLFLDEIGDLEKTSQVKLLRLLQEKLYYPLGSDVVKTTNTRIVVATNVNLEKKQDSGEFRKDLFYRFTHRISVPSLKDRMDDIPILVHHFFEKIASDLNKKVPEVPKELMILLRTYHFPGNVRELELMIENALVSHKSKVLSLKVFKDYIQAKGKTIQSESTDITHKESSLVLDEGFPTLKEAEYFLINEALKRSENNQAIAANMLGLSPSALNKRLKRNKT